MPTIADIPTWLLFLSQRQAFMDWLRDLPLSRGDKKALMFMWSRALETTWTGDEVLDVLGPE